MKKKYVSAMVLAALLGAQCYTGGVEASYYTDVSSEENLNITGDYTYGIQNVSGTTTNYTGEEISIANEGTVGSQPAAVKAGANSSNPSVINLGGDATKNITISINNQNKVVNGLQMGLFAQGGKDKKGGQINVKGNNLTISGDSGFDYVYGVISQNMTTDSNKGEPNESKDGETLINIDTDNTYINVSSGKENCAYGLVAMSNGNINVNSNLEVHADGGVILARGDAVVNINEDGKHSTKLYGDINFNYDSGTSGTNVDSTVNVNLTGKESIWEGNTIVSWDGAKPNDLETLKVENTKLTLADGAQWNVAAVEEYDRANGTFCAKYTALDNLNLNGGIINITGAKEQKPAEERSTVHTGVTIENLSGTGGTVNLEAADDFSTRELNIQNANGNGETPTQLAVNFTGINADDISTDKTKQQEQMNALAGNIKFGTGGTVISGEKLTATTTVGEGLINGGISAVMNTAAAGGTGAIQDGTIHQNNTTTTMDNMRDLAAVSIAAWRQEDSTLSQRLGDLRESKEGQGIWARMNRGEFEYSGAFKNQYNYFQIGYDMAKGDWHYGAAVSHTDGETSYASGYGENDSTSLSLYGTRLMNDGQYLDLVLKVGRLSNEFDNYAETAGHTHGDYDAWGTAISGEYGKKLDLKEGWFVTPQAQLSLMRIGGEDYTTNNGIAVSQDTLYSAVGRIGFEAGKDTGWGSLYAKASVLHEFAGDADTYVRRVDQSNSYSQDLGDTWYEAGFGFNWKMGNGSYFYADVIRTFGGDIDTPWQWNAGIRWGF